MPVGTSESPVAVKEGPQTGNSQDLWGGGVIVELRCEDSLVQSAACRPHSEVVVSMYMYVYIKEGPGIGRGPPHAPGALRTVPRCAFVAPIPSSPPVPVGNATSSPNSDPKPTLS